MERKKVRRGGYMYTRRRESNEVWDQRRERWSGAGLSGGERGRQLGL